MGHVLPAGDRGASFDRFPGPMQPSTVASPRIPAFSKSTASQPMSPGAGCASIAGHEDGPRERNPQGSRTKMVETLIDGAGGIPIVAVTTDSFGEWKAGHPDA